MPYSRLEKSVAIPAALLGLLRLLLLLNLRVAVFAGQSDTVEITGEGVTTCDINPDQLQAMEQYRMYTVQ